MESRCWVSRKCVAECVAVCYESVLQSVLQCVTKVCCRVCCVSVLQLPERQPRRWSQARCWGSRNPQPIRDAAHAQPVPLTGACRNSRATPLRRYSTSPPPVNIYVWVFVCVYVCSYLWPPRPRRHDPRAMSLEWYSTSPPPVNIYICVFVCVCAYVAMGWLWLVGYIKT